MNKYAAVYGAGGHARVVASVLHACNIPILGFFDNSYHGPEEILGVPVLGPFRDILNYRESFSSVYIALGDNALRKQAFEFLLESQVDLPALIHPTAICEVDVVVDQGAVVCLGAIVGTGVFVGKGAIVNTGCAVDHETSVGDFVHLAPKVVIAGRVRIGANTFVGMNTCIGDKLTVGKNVTIGAGSVVLRDVPDGAKVVGVYH